MAGEVRLVVKARLHRDAGSGQAREQHPARELHPPPDQIAVRGKPEFGGEGLHEVGGVDVQPCGRVVERQPRHEVGVEQVA